MNTKLLFLSAFLLIVPGISMANSLQALETYRGCIAENDNLLTSAYQKAFDGMVHGDVLTTWALNLLPHDQVSLATQDLKNGNMHSAEQLLHTLERRLDNNLYEEVLAFSTAKLRESSSATCRTLGLSLAQNMQHVLLEAIRLKGELAQSVRIAQMNNRVQDNFNQLKRIINELSQLQSRLSNSMTTGG